MRKGAQMMTATRAAVRGPAARHPLGGRPLRGQPWPTLLVVGLGVMMADLDMTVVSVANPVLKRSLDASLAEVEWITNGYLLAVAMCLIPAGRLADRLGHRQTFLLGVAAFAVASAGAGLSGHVVVVIVFRVLQGLSAALLMPAALAVLRAAFPPERLSTALGVYGMIIGTATAAGPAAGGMLVEHLGWRSVFFINVPVGALVLMAGLLVLKDHRMRGDAGLDIAGTVLLAGTLLCVIWPLIEAGGRAAHGIWGYAAGAIALSVAFVVRERRARHPVLPLQIFRSVRITAGVVLVALMAFVLVGGLFFVTFYLQNVLHLSPAESGLRLLPLTGVIIAASPAAGVLIGKMGPRVPIMCGMLMTAAAMLGLSTLTVGTPAVTTSVWLALLGAGLAPVMVGSTDVIVGNAAPESAGLAAGLHQTAVQVGGALGTSVLAALVAARVRQELPSRWAASDLTSLSDRQREELADAVSVGNALLPPHTPAPAAEKLTAIAHQVFLSGTHLAFTVAFGVALTAALVAVLVGRTTGLPKRAHEGEGA